MRKFIGFNMVISILFFHLFFPAESYALIKIATGSQAGTYYIFGQDIAKIAKENGIEVQVLKTEGSLHNIDLMEKNKADLSIVQSDVLGWLYKKDPQIIDRIKIIFQLYDEEIHIFAQKDIHSLKDLQRKKVSVGTANSGTWLTASCIFYKLYLSDLEKITNLNPESAVAAVLTGDLDAMFYVAGKPVSLFKKLEKMSKDPAYSSLMNKVHFVPITENSLIENYYVPSTIGPSDYSWLGENTSTIGVKALIVSYSHDKQLKNLAQHRCDEELKKLSDIIKKNLGYLRQNGHDKWKTVELDAEIVRPWKVDPCGCYGVDIQDLKDFLK